ncbi:MAG: hypothetical protein PHQ58_04770 [Rhodoferax sp.]|uniref:hypothetical protein n=1 Tax=Rhodoferax sp. TaxID=50421 RepID=UPI00262031B1|nr:hypothetical protein [Rhodoferax sp.]MDD2879726.1 hypothetical protein [Rhodoferax sp.]
MLLPKKLYHGSAYRHTELMPGFNRTGSLVEWDKTENNKFLYATADRDSAIELGFASSIEKKFYLDRFKSSGRMLLIETPDKTLTVSKLYELDVFLYDIIVTVNDGWVKNNNQHNGITTEFKTPKTITSIEKCEKINVREWLSNFDVQIKTVNQSQESLRSDPAKFMDW